MTLHLIPSELKLFKKLPAALRKGVEVIKETGTAWETDEQLVERIQYVQKNIPSKAKTALKKMFVKLDVKGFDGIKASDFPADVLPYLLYMLGAVGLTGMISMTLSTAHSQEDFEAIEECANARHRMLQSNLTLLSH